MNAHEALHQYFRDSCRNDTGSIKEAYELSLAAEKHYAEQEAEIVNLKEKIASQANMIDKLQVKAGHVDLLRGALNSVINHKQINSIIDWVICGICANSTQGGDCRESRMGKYHEFKLSLEAASNVLEQTKES